MSRTIKHKPQFSTLRKVKNAGFSLIELIIAVAILAVIIVPILNSFISSSNTSARSQKIGEATDAATNILEALNSTSISNFTDSCSGGSGNVDMVSLLSMGGNAVTLSADADNQTVTTVSKKYYIQGVKMGSSEFDARVTVTPGEAGTDTNGFYELNSNEIVKYIDPDQTFVQPYSDDANPDFISSANNGSKTFNEYYAKSGNSMFKNVQRTITIDISQSTSRVYAYVTYNYLFTYEKDVRTDGYVVVSRKYAIFPGGQTRYENDSTPVTAYVMYYPFYSHVDSGNNDGRGLLDQYSNRSDIRNEDGVNVIFEGNTDRIVVNNTSDVSIKLYLVKQRPLVKQAYKKNGVWVPEVDADNKYIYKKMTLQGVLDEDDDGVEECAVDHFGTYTNVEQYETAYRTSITEIRSTTYMAGYVNQLYSNAAFNTATGKKIVGVSPSYYQVVTNPLVAENCSENISGSLVNTELVDRIYYVSIEMFPAGSLVDGSISDDIKCTYKLSGSAMK